MGNLEYGNGLLVKKVITVCDAEVADSINIGEVGHGVSTVDDQMQIIESKMVRVVSRLEQVRPHVEQGQQAATQRDETIMGLSQQFTKLLVPVSEVMMSGVFCFCKHRSLTDIYVGSGSKNLEIIMNGCIGFQTKDCNSQGNFGYVMALE
uniref:Uncharacterized protein n=1 Tax=Tanacetum cinerariifolium TaxID=118510 RepID=A0A699LCE8_TANCI|nr:hypothetical protein [Tanacetum cinerariifolium]